MLHSFMVLLFIFEISFVNTYFSSQNEETITSLPDPLDELHMDSVPTGYLPDSVYRELAWYGILQIQPLYRSTKHKVAARWIWQNTLGRPHVVVENQPQTSQSEDSAGYQTILEESVKWSREQRTAQDVLMENVRNGGNGLTVRTVISATQKTVYIIQNGKYYSCEDGSEPDMEAYRAQTNMHERQCTSGKLAVPLSLQMDPCIEAETAPLEYSFIYDWMFCFGDGERDTTYSSNGDLDCGKKTKIRFTDFLKECAIDNNVVITYEYFGDEPRKDMVHNTTLCTSWDPCRISYLYRIELPESTPEIPTTTEDPCDTTFCPECIEGFTEEIRYPFEEAETKDRLISTSNTGLIEWIPVTNQTIDPYLTRAMRVGFSKSGHNFYLIRFPILEEQENVPGFYTQETGLAHVGYYDNGYVRAENFEVAIAKGELKWIRSGNSCPYPIVLGKDNKIGTTLGICRGLNSFDLKPGKYHMIETPACLIAADGTQIHVSNDYEILCAEPDLRGVNRRDGNERVGTMEI